MKRVVFLALALGALIAPAGAHAAGDRVAEATAREAAAGDAVVARVVAESGAVGGRTATSREGCRTVDVSRVGRDIFGFVVYRFHQRKRWCWDYPRIISRAVTVYVTDVDPNMDYHGVTGAIGYFYRWCCSRIRSGHYSFRQGKFRNCILWFPCTRTEYPWVKIWVRANGSWSYDTGL